jgi:hypothetical protein
MSRSGAVVFLVVAPAMPAVAADLPSRNVGLWEINQKLQLAQLIALYRARTQTVQKLL